MAAVLAAQAYWPADIGRAKVTATAELCHHINSQINLKSCEEWFRRSMAQEFQGSATAVVRCVDSITTRGLMWESVKKHADLFVDGRMSAEVMRVLASDRPGDDSYYTYIMVSSSSTARLTIMCSRAARWKII